jgi:hypothetical protein
MRTFKTYSEFLGEAKLPYSIEKSIQSSNLSWKEDKKAAEELIREHGKDTTHNFVYVANDSDRGIEYTYKTWMNELQYWIQLEFDGRIEFIQDYQQTEKRYYDQDTENIIGFKIK